MMPDIQCPGAVIPLQRGERRGQDHGLEPAGEMLPADAAGRHEFAPTTRRRQFAVLICSFLAVSMTIGPNFSYGVFQEYYVTSTDSVLDPSEAKNRAAVALVGTLGAGLTWSGSIVINPLVSRVSGNANQKIVTAGCCLMSASYALASLSQRVSESKQPHPTPYPIPPCIVFHKQCTLSLSLLAYQLFRFDWMVMHPVCFE
ncbi:uncharacterized protein ARB_04080 [Trichophyton benhamiae CBS 112371]|uniref:Uncharacterized protein n=1 Tax=Arthroderma benhamiae (strain ATCC MYA-4681 / CBS 112371) TaxID=663331 RepID=D4AII5_ARTBC|nr:uncharacterized protein ARB_04080 [Trichophyton benhamiae CBS 112371]EFE36558.1 hypothetical protein ARB_04080 [Trichophyton benhamiae CBS 112371]